MEAQQKCAVLQSAETGGYVFMKTVSISTYKSFVNIF